MPPKASVRGEYIETETGNKISRRASILGPKHIILAGKCVIQNDVIIHGDLIRPLSSSSLQQQQSSSKTNINTNNPKEQQQTKQDQTSIHLGRYVFISSGCTIHPPSRLTTTINSEGKSIQTSIYFPLRISDYVFIGPNSHIRAAEIKSNVWIGSNCNIGNMVLIKDNVKILDGTILPANSVWSSGCIIAGKPGKVVGELGEGWNAGGIGGGSGSSNSTGGITSSGGGGMDEGIGIRSRERWASVGNKK